jgi:predicted Zn-dependent protease with MMP-like domain
MIMDKGWQSLCEWAGHIVEKVVAELPPEIRAEANQIPYLFEPRCLDDPDILGIYGHFSPGEVSDSNGPIILYLHAIEDYCVEEDLDFADEVRTTFLHELGHHFGWDEGDLELRGLD